MVHLTVFRRVLHETLYSIILFDLITFHKCSSSDFMSSFTGNLHGVSLFGLIALHISSSSAFTWTVINKSVSILLNIYIDSTEKFLYGDCSK